ncbi:MAG TPA: AgmX/PglI C-terminal domain-containing protein, partial [Kofleriaceae bacterium]
FSSKSVTPGTTLTAEMVIRKITPAYLPAIKRCYRDALATNPRLAGNQAVEFFVDETGRADGVKVKGLDATVNDCVKDLVKSWRFPIPRDRDGDPYEAGVEIGLTYAPDS